MNDKEYRNTTNTSSASYILGCIFLFVLSNVNAQQTINSSIIHDDQERSYITYVPESYTGDNPVAVVFNFHGYTSNAESQMGYGDFRAVADRENFLVVHPQGTIDPTSGQTFWNAQWAPNGVDDIGFVSALIDSLAAEYNVDLTRVYSTGMSNGGFLSHTLACELSDKIAAIASVTGSMTTIQTSLSCNPTNKTPMVENNNCSTEPEITQIEDINTNDQTTVEKHVYTGCSEGGSVEFFIVDGGGHTWPGTAFTIGATNQDINASEEIWRFFSQYNIDGVITSSTTIADEDYFNIYPTLSTDYLEVEFHEKGIRDLSILSYDGKLLMNQTVSDKNIELNVSGLESGTYFINVKYKNKIITRPFIKA